MQYIAKRAVYLLLLLCLATGCESFLDEKPNKQQVVPETLADFQALLDNFSIINDSDPSSSEISSDDYYLTDADWAGLTEEYRRVYVWEKDLLFARGATNNWAYSYRPVYTANTILENIGKVDRSTFNQVEWDNVKGQALFIRGKSFLQVAAMWAMAYDASTAATDLGIPLRLDTNFDSRSTRASLHETYDQVLSDLKASVSLLPEVQVHPTRPTKAAAYALLARTYLYRRHYSEAAAYADSSLRLHSYLMDFNTLNPSATYPVRQDNQEIMFRSIMRVPAPLNVSRGKIEPALIQSYAADDLRKVIFFRNNGNGTYGFKGSYEGAANLFSGIATDEVYLMRAEAQARLGKTDEAMEDLNTLLVTRWRTGTFVPFTAATPQEAVDLTLQERRKELLFRGLRWMDLKRLNKEGADITLTRSLNGQIYTLAPNDPRYALPIPEDVIELAGIQQNPR
ncbi:RagB/SusD family nutrient uptake outer membrane protein [Pontibacter sp. SGAir0037]|uniref:RagB/SusD family nutrient uptake outer membrane protein n=1 Tax=Pontibacter sp. SGAir0037 TaxID=2571030 RepID=UPI0010F75750|nr:RagB/SusD family nutrient uptake outer membrane protein [Pontibacter sp. SGAir0037]